jgi:hypothetical protein
VAVSIRLPFQVFGPALTGFVLFRLTSADVLQFFAAHSFPDVHLSEKFGNMFHGDVPAISVIINGFPV